MLLKKSSQKRDQSNTTIQFVEKMNKSPIQAGNLWAGGLGV